MNDRHDRLAPLEPATVDMLVVNEVYASIQGESSWAGLPCVFVRLTACDLRCRWCDSAYTFRQGQPQSISSVLEQVRGFGLGLVEVTGGEPLLQPAVQPLMRALLADGQTVLLETSGAADVSGVDPRVVKIMDLKCPGSGEQARNLWSNLDHLSRHDEVKFVLADRGDYEWARGTIREHDLARRARLLLSPVHGRLDPRELVGWMLEDRLPARLNLQLHKVVWPEAKRGV